VVRVQVKLPSYIAKEPGTDTTGWRTIEKETGKGTTVRKLLSILVATYPGFRESVFNPDTGSINEQINVVLNTQLLTFAEILQTELADNDTITLLPIYLGG
jgi:molybdopterin converting factor small subunit